MMILAAPTHIILIKNSWKLFEGKANMCGWEKLQQISIPFLICLSCLRTLLRGDYEFLNRILSCNLAFFPRRIRCNKSFDIVNFNSSRPRWFMSLESQNHFCIIFETLFCIFLWFLHVHSATLRRWKMCKRKQILTTFFIPLFTGISGW